MSNIIIFYVEFLAKNLFQLLFQKLGCENSIEIQFKSEIGKRSNYTIFFEKMTNGENKIFNHVEYYFIIVNILCENKLIIIYKLSLSKVKVYYGRKYKI